MGDEDIKNQYHVGFFVVVEVDAFDREEAAFIAGAAAGWPMHRHHLPVEVSAPFDGGRTTVEAKIISAEALMVRDVPPECELCGGEHVTDECSYPRNI